MPILATETYTIHSLDGDIPAEGSDLLAEGATSDWSDSNPMPITDRSGEEIGYVDPGTGEVWDRVGGVLLAPMQRETTMKHPDPVDWKACHDA